MFITLYTCRSKPGQTDAIRSLYAEWDQLVRTSNGVTTEFLSSSEDASEVVLLARFPNEEAAWLAAEAPPHRSWYARLARLTEAGPIVTQYETMPGDKVTETVCQ